METIHLYHTNDLHSHLEHWPRIQQFLKQKNALHLQQEEDVFLFDIGDFLDRWHPLTEATKGQGNITLLNDAHYTAVTIGNNEGVNLPYEDLDQLYDDAAFDVLVANLYKKDGHYPEWVKPYKIYQTKKGTRIGVIGITAPFPQLYELLGWKLTEPLSELKKWLTPLKEEADFIILLSHLGKNEDERIATEFPEIDVILGAHTHHFFEKGMQVGDTLLGAAGKYGYYVGEVLITLNDQKTVTNKEAILYDFIDLPMIKNEQEQILSFLNKGKELLNKPVATLREPLVHDPFRETNFSKLLSQTLREWCNADCAMINAGLLLGTLAGEVTNYDLLEVCPHPINPCVVELTGLELQTVLFQTRDETLPHKQIKGLGFRGTVLGVFVYDGIHFEKNTVFVNGSEIVYGKNYTLALPDMFTFGHFFKEVLPHKQKHYFLPEFLRDLIKWRLQLPSSPYA
ncbi:bifunctional metallophosphatase/5'-nucleotidase [Neobacillus sp. MM2021_6]|uniref:bifunctional metallophosphatase/5'-nucleotidase n=1 Tax=Bacillaceae TaxID=186817 RepID=UPI00140D7D05|nr:MULTISPECIES: bifunctional UDP-sugar hydrolase/5'-nucleotidase [Bacillaceae]MBO0958931.1 bifunctional metallophosphatase/5'-nucleotidase [Neobacillus sp. MM2021_6]NHC17660.1 bifunctional metallophosphatase/5'-nucleotidase [Bacillus sp. MM2020_4]